MKTVALANVLMVSTFAASTALAGGVALPVRGVRALSMGGAFVAGADGVNAFWYNPSRLDETSLSLEVGIVAMPASFTAADGEQAGITVDNEGRPLPNPTFGFVLRVTDMLSVGVAAYAPYSGFQRFGEAGPTRYALVESDRSTLLYLHAGAAFRFGKFRIGGGVQNVIAHLKQRIVLSGYSGLFGHAEDPELDILEEIDLKDSVNFTGNIGASFDMGPVTLGLAVQLPYKLSSDATFRIRPPSSVFFDAIEVEGQTVFMEIPFPLAIRGGAQWRVNERWLIEAAVNFENWSVQDKLTIDPKGNIKLHGVPGIGDYDLPALVIDRRMKDTISIHLGTDVEVVENLHLRGGGFYEPSAFGDETYSVAQLDDDKIGLALGASYDIGPMRFDLAASHVFSGTREVRTSELRQLNPTNPNQTIVIGNGTYQTSYWVAGLGVSWLIGR